MPKKLKRLPQFKNEDEEREFWATHDATEYLEEIKGPVSFPHLKPSKLPTITEAGLAANPEEILKRVAGRGEVLVVKRGRQKLAVILPYQLYRRYKSI
jgi:prevent-host-death family protein